MSRQATTTPNSVGTVTKDTLICAVIDVMGITEDELYLASFNELKELASRQVWDYLKR